MPVTRVRDPRIQPLEVWDTQVQGRSLFAWQTEACFGARMAEALRLLRAGDATFGTTLAVVRGAPLFFESLYLTGAGVRRPGLVESIREEGFVCQVDDEPAYPGVAGARELAGTDDVLGIDVGQTAIKTWWRGRRVRTPRDWARLPAPGDVPDSERDRHRASFIDFFGEAARALLGEEAPPTVVLALPTQVSDAGVLSGCTYPFPTPDPTLLGELLAAGALQDAEVRVLNDAELAATSAKRKLAGTSRGGVLVLTFGYGVGAALWTGA